MPQRDKIHDAIRQALIKEGWEITDDPYVISYGERFLFIDLAANADSLYRRFRAIYRS
jgi:XisH protein